MKINNHNIDGKSTYFVVEEGQANLGRFDYALKMIDEASKTGANAIEFQLAVAEDFYIESHEGYKIYREREFSDDQLKQLVEHSNEKGLDMIVAPLSVSLIEPMAKFGCAAFNINASDLITPDMLDAVSDSGVPFFLSLLLSDESEIDWAVNRITKRGGKNFGLLLGQHTMASGEDGVHLAHTNFGYISTLKQKYQVPVGFIDHSPLLYNPSIAIAAGAEVITKHLAISKDLKGPDWQVCLEVDEMKQAISMVRDINASLNATQKTLAPGENMDKAIMRRSIVAATQINAGDIIKMEDILYKRPGNGIAANLYEDVVGKAALKTLEKDQIISFDDLSQ